ncbi:MAG: hypothetical protein R3174_00055 [Gammaproteobacteria bacterium]|nr:hypothetical protein [Gammaproteobacteria bacterium]
MDKSYSTPGDVAKASQEDVARLLGRVLRTVSGTTQFIYEADFGFANGRKGPLLMVGALRGAWREYIRRNAASPRFAAGECEVKKDDSGKLIIELRASRGKGTNASHARALNAGPLRRLGAQARFVTEATASEPVPAAEPADVPEADAAGETPAPVAAPEADQGEADIGALGQSILKQFAGFKTAPTMEVLTELTGKISRFNELRASGAEPDPKAAQQIGQIANLLDTKGRAYVAQKGGGKG